MKKTIVFLLAMMIALPALTISQKSFGAEPNVGASSPAGIERATIHRTIKVKPRQVVGTVKDPCAEVPDISVELFADGGEWAVHVTLPHFDTNQIEGVRLDEVARIREKFFEENHVPTIEVMGNKVLRLKYSFPAGYGVRLGFNNPVGTMMNTVTFVQDLRNPGQLYHTISDKDETRIRALEFVDRMCGNALRTYYLPIKTGRIRPFVPAKPR